MKEGDRYLARFKQNIPELILETGWFLTRDEDQPDQPPRPLPDKPYLRYLLREYTKYRRVLVPKSRQILVTWSWVAYALALCLLRQHLLIIYQTKREEDSVGFMNRVHFMYRHFPDWLRDTRPAVLDNTSKIEFPKTDNRFWGIPQGADIIRSNTVSLFLADEVNFQPNAKASLRAAMPSVGRNGQAIWASSAAAGGLMINLIHADW